MIQYFEWYYPSDRSLYRKIISESSSLAKTGFNLLWMPPAYKGAAGINDVGYGPYDLYDLGEFKQKGSQSTKYGTKRQYLKAIQSLQNKGIFVLADIVFNHKMGGDTLESAIAQTVDGWNRNKVIEPEHEVETWTGFTYPERKGTYSTFCWNHTHFTGTDYDAKTNMNAILLFQGKHWNEHVSQEEGNYDYLMGCDVDFHNQEVIQELYAWGKWYTQQSQVDGFRLDAIKNIDSSFFPCWLAEMHRYGNHPNFTIGEYWTSNVYELQQYLKDCNFCMRLMDVPLHYHLQQVSMSNGTYDIRKIFHETLSRLDPYHSMQFVDNHDTQIGQALESWILDWFKPQAYATILLYDCQCPCVFYGDYYGIPHDNKAPVPFLREMVWIRANLLSDNIVNLMDDDPQKACWMAYGPHPVIVLYTIADWKEKSFCEPNYANLTLEDALDPTNQVKFDAQGNIKITCPPGKISIYLLDKDALKLHKAIQ